MMTECVRQELIIDEGLIGGLRKKGYQFFVDGFGTVMIERNGKSMFWISDELTKVLTALKLAEQSNV